MTNLINILQVLWQSGIAPALLILLIGLGFAYFKGNKDISELLQIAYKAVLWAETEFNGGSEQKRRRPLKRLLRPSRNWIRATSLPLNKSTKQLNGQLLKWRKDKRNNMNILKKALVITGAFFAFAGIGYVSADTASANGTPRVDMVDTSNHNGQMTTPEFTYMRNTYGVKAITTKISEGVGFHDYTARGNIASAKQAGLYINGYHFLHATTTAGAIQEADYAVNMAKADGLPVGDVLAVDIENQYQLRMGSAMQPVAKAFENEVARYGGYRSTTYTGGSAMNVSPAGEKTWLAQYP